MATEPKAEGNGGPNAGGTPKPPVPPTPPTPPEGNAPLTAADVERILDQRLTPVNSKVDKLFSRQENTRQAQEKTDTTLRDFMAEVRRQEAAGLEGEAAINAADAVITARNKQSERDAKIDRLLENAQPPAPVTVDVAKVVAPYGFSKDDADANNLIQQFGSDPDKLDGALAKLAFQRLKSPPSNAQSAAPEGKTPPAEGEDPRIAEMNELMRHPTRNPKRFKELKAELDAEDWGQKP